MTGVKHDQGKLSYALIDFSVIYGPSWSKNLSDPNSSLEVPAAGSPWASEFCKRAALLAEHRAGHDNYDEDEVAWAINQFVAVMNEGAKKHGNNNWQEVRPISRYFSALIRHDLAAKLSGEYVAINKEDFGLPHLAHSMWNCYVLAWFERAGVREW